VNYPYRNRVACLSLLSLLALSSVSVAWADSGGSGNACDDQAQCDDDGHRALLKGVVASGYAVANNPGYALDATSGTQIPFTTGANGSYSVNIAGYVGPFLLHVLGMTSGGSSVDLYSLASASSAGATVNVTPLSDVVLAYAAGVTTQNLEATCTANLPACPALLNGILAGLTVGNSAVVAAIPASVWSAFGINSATFSAITTQFAATHAGVDGLLDALSIVPPVTTGGSYTISLVGATSSVLATVPTSGSPGTSGGIVVHGPAPAPTAIAQARSLVSVQGEIRAFFARLSALFATAQPTAAQVEALLAPGFLFDGQNAAVFGANFANSNPVGYIITGGGVAPYSGAQYTGALGTPPGPAITYDANNCVTSIWVYTSSTNNTSLNLVDTIPATNPPGSCNGGTWRLAGDGKTYRAFFYASFQRQQTQLSSTGATYYQGVKLATTGSPTPYTYVAVGAPGFTTVGAQQARLPDVGYVLIVPFGSLANTTTGQIDPYYAGGNLLRSCAAILASGSLNYSSGTPCYDANLVSGSDLGIGFFDAAFNLLALEQQRLNVSPATIVLPTSYFPTITGVSPAIAASIATGSTVTTVTVTAKAPAGSTYGAVSLSYSATGVGNIYSDTVNVATGPTPVATPFSVTGLSVAPTNGFAGTDDLIGGLHVMTGYTF